MNTPSRHVVGSAEPLGWDFPENTRCVRRHPALIVTVELEGKPTVRIVADSFEDERRLRVWVEGAAVRESLVLALSETLKAAA